MSRPYTLMTRREIADEGELGRPALSKRAARRLIQRAFVLVGRDRNLRHHLREASITTLWVLDDWGFSWTVVLDHGTLEFHRGKAGKPHLTYLWRTASQFFARIERGAAETVEYTGSPAARQTLEPVYEAFCKYLQEVLRDPVGENGDRLM